MIEMLVALPMSARFVTRMRAVDPRLNVRMAPPSLRRFLGNDMPAAYTGWFLGGEPAPADEDGSLEEQITAYLAPAEVLIALPRISPEALARAERLRWIQFVSAGVEHFDLHGVPHVLVTNASGSAAGAIAEHVTGMMLLFARNLLGLLDRQREHDWDRSLIARELQGATCGIVGLGAIGSEVARRARALGMRVIASRRSAGPGASHPLADELLPPAALDELLAKSEYVVLSAPLTSETRHLIDARAVRVMRSDAVLINVGRGGLIDEQALVAALRAGAIGGAALDVVEQEPLPADSPLWTLPNVVITPHSSARTNRHFDRVGDVVATNLERYLSGRPLQNLVDPERGY